jgi:TolA-binding protein
MENEMYIEEVLDAVVKDRLPEAQAVFILRDQQVADAQGEITLHKAAASVVRMYAAQEQVRAIHQEYLQRLGAPPQGVPTDAVVRRFSWKPLLRVAAVLVLVVSGWFTYQLASTSGDSLYAEMYQPFTIDTERGQANAVSGNLVDRFRAGDYLGVIRLYTQTQGTDNRERFLAAYALQSTGAFEESLKPLRAIIDQNRRTGTMLYQDEAEYYLGLALLRTKAYEEAEQIFSAIAQDKDHTYHDRVAPWMLTRLRWLR